MKHLTKGALRTLGVMATMHVICLVFISLMLSELVWLSTVSIIAALLVYLVVAYAEGASRGEKAAAVSERVQKQMETTGLKASESEEEAMFAPWKGFAVGGLTALYALAALVIASAAIAIFTGTAFWGTLEVVYRLVMSPFVGLYVLLGANAWILYPFSLLLFPLVYSIAWLQGPSMRAKLHKTIEESKTKYQKRAKRDRNRRLREYDKQNLSSEQKKGAGGKKRPRV